MLRLNPNNNHNNLRLLKFYKNITFEKLLGKYRSFIINTTFIHLQQRFLRSAVRSSAQGRNNNKKEDSFSETKTTTLNQPKSTIIDNELSFGPDDYLGFQPILDWDIIYGEYTFSNQKHFKKMHKEELLKKYSPLLNSVRKESTKPIQDVMKKKWFGHIRLDSENAPRYHGEFELKEDIGYNKTSNTISKNKTSTVELLNHLAQFKISHLPSLNEKKEGSEIEEEKARIKFLKQQELLVIDENIKTMQRPSSLSVKSLIKDKIRFHHSEKFSKFLLKSTKYSCKNNRNKTEKLSDLFEKDKNDPVIDVNKVQDMDNVKFLNSREELLQKLSSIKYEDVEKDCEMARQKNRAVFSLPRTISGFEYLREIKTGVLKPKFEKEYEEVQKFIRKMNKLDSKGLILF